MAGADPLVAAGRQPDRGPVGGSVDRGGRFESYHVRENKAFARPPPNARPANAIVSRGAKKVYN